MFLVAMQQGGFPRVNKNNKWGFLGKQLGVIPKEKAPSQQEIEQVRIQVALRLLVLLRLLL